MELTAAVLSCVTKIYAANLIHLHFACCLVVDFRLYDLSSLVDASLYLYDDLPEQDVALRVLGLLSGVLNVEKLWTTCIALEYLTLIENLLDRLPTFSSMTHLVLGWVFSGPSFGVIMDLLEKNT